MTSPAPAVRGFLRAQMKGATSMRKSEAPDRLQVQVYDVPAAIVRSIDDAAKIALMSRSAYIRRLLAQAAHVRLEEPAR
jgi:hypothetical protein